MGRLSSSEREQLAALDAPSGPEWRAFRRFVAERDLSRRENTNPKLMAYTPGETVDLFLESEVATWHKTVAQFQIPEEYKLVCFVPCAATKPWDEATRGIYKSYNQLRVERDNGDLPKFYFATLSEPLGVVPERHWSDFPQYENPGLFKNSFLRFGMTNKELQQFFGREVRLPFGESEFHLAIRTLAKVIENFASNNTMPGRKFISFVEGLRPDQNNTHSQMLTLANQTLHFMDQDDRFPKRAKAREAPYQFLKRTILEQAV